MRAWLAVLLGLVLLASACGGEVTEDAGDDAGGEVASDDASDDSAEDAGDDSSSGGATNDDAGGEATDGDEPNIYVDPRGGVFADFQAG
ncbi:MAG TPA: hypothetical protein DCE75_11470, partial [Acidimicrobiaceae bacterium]|nr:hypothetical protein [Acidimicrobiaceae bacterium]